MSQIIEALRDPFTISTDPARLDVDAVRVFLSHAYWANERILSSIHVESALLPEWLDGDSRSVPWEGAERGL